MVWYEYHDDWMMCVREEPSSYTIYYMIYNMTIANTQISAAASARNLGVILDSCLNIKNIFQQSVNLFLLNYRRLLQLDIF